MVVERANEQVATRRAGGDLEEKTMTPEQNLDSIIQLKLKLAEKQTILDELSSKYIALQASVQKQRLESQFQANTEQNMLAVLTENSKLRQENESLRLKLRVVLKAEFARWIKAAVAKLSASGNAHSTL